MAKSAVRTKSPVAQRLNRAERRGRRYATLQQAGDYIGVTSRCVREMIADGRLTGYRNGTRLVRVNLDEIDEKLMQPFGGTA